MWLAAWVMVLTLLPEDLNVGQAALFTLALIAVYFAVHACVADEEMLERERLLRGLREMPESVQLAVIAYLSGDPLTPTQLVALKFWYGADRRRRAPRALT